MTLYIYFFFIKVTTFLYMSDKHYEKLKTNIDKYNFKQ